MGYIYLLVRAEGFLKGTSSYTTGKVSWLSEVLAQHIPGLECQPTGGSHPATGPHAAGEWRLLDGEWGASWMGSCWGKQKVWLTASPDKCHPRPQTDNSATDDVTGIRPPRTHTPSPPPVSLLCLPSASLPKALYRQDQTRAVATDLCIPSSLCLYSSPRLNQLIPACHRDAKILALCDCHLPSQTWAAFNKLPLHHPRHPALSCRCEFSLTFVTHRIISPARKQLSEVHSNPPMWPWCGSAALTLPTCLTFIGQVLGGMCLQQFWLIAPQISHYHHAYQNKHSAKRENMPLYFPWEKMKEE